MDIFNKKKIKSLESQIRELTAQRQLDNNIIKFLIEEPNSETSLRLKEILTNKFMKRRWSGLTKEGHLLGIFPKSVETLITWTKHL